MTVQQITPKRLKTRLDTSTSPPLLLDVRESAEHAHCRIAGSILIPLQEIPSRLSELPLDAEIIVYCHHGIRSMQAATFLSQRGYSRVCNLLGGIDAWSSEVDPSVSRY